MVIPWQLVSLELTDTTNLPVPWINSALENLGRDVDICFKVAIGISMDFGSL